jgi:hypothetical protein
VRGLRLMLCNARMYSAKEGGVFWDLVWPISPSGILSRRRVHAYAGV